MSNRQIMNVPSHLDIAHDIWISCLFVPPVIAYAYLLIFVDKLFDAPIFDVLGISFGAILVLGVNYAAKHSKNDFIAGPIELLNLYTFFFLGLMLGSIELAFLFAFLYEIFETYGWRSPFLRVFSISGNEWKKAESLGIPRKYFNLYQFVFAPLATIASLWLAVKFSESFFTIESLATMNYANQIKNLSILIAAWKAFETFLISIYNKFFPKIGLEGVLFPITFFANAHFLSVYNNRATWFLYGGFIILGWITVIMQSIYLFTKQIEDEDERKYMRELREKYRKK